MRAHRLAVGLVAGTVVLTGCAGTSSDSDDGGDNGTSGELSAVPGFDPADGTIHVGAIMPLSGPLAVAGQALVLGMNLYAERINEAGGIAGQYPIEITTVDSEYDPQTGLAAYNGMAEDVTMAVVLGTNVVQAILPRAEADNTVLIPATNSSEWLRIPNTLPTAPSYEASAINGFAYANEQQEGLRYCALLQDDPLGESIKRGVDHVVSELDLDYAEEVSFPVGNTDFTPQISQLNSGGCEVVAFGGTVAALGPAVTSSVQLGFEPQWFGPGPAYAANLLGSPIYDYVAEHVFFATAGTQWGDDSVEGMAMLLEDFEKYAPEGVVPDLLMESGYLYGMVMEDLLEEAVDQGDLSHESILDISQSGLEVDFKGLFPNLTYGPVDERQSPSALTIFAMDKSVPAGLRAVEKNLDSDAAQSFEVE